MLLISGGHCLLAVVQSPTKFLLLGQSLDDAPGEAMDKVKTITFQSTIILNNIFYILRTSFCLVSFLLSSEKYIYIYLKKIYFKICWVCPVKLPKEFYNLN